MQNMTSKPTETFTVENRGGLVKPRRSRASDRRSLTTLLPAILGRGEEKDPKPRFDVDKLTCEAERQDPAHSPMRVLLQNAKTQKFLSGATSWTKDPKRARDFHSGWWATVYAFTMNPRNLVIHYEFANDRYNLHIPVLGQEASEGNVLIEPA